MDHGFLSGLVLGLLAALAVALLAARKRGKRRVRPWAGLALTVAAVLAFAGEFTPGSDFVLGLVVLAAGGWLSQRVDRPVVRMLAAAPGAVILARSTDLHDPSWAVAVMLIVTVVGGTLVADFDRSFATTGQPPVLLAVTLLGVYATTPDTDHAVILAGVALPIAALGWPRPIASLGAAGSSLVTGLMSWIVVTDGAARPGAIVGGFACLGLLVLEPALRWTSRARAAAESSLPVGSVPLLLALHVGVVAVCSRVAGLRTPATQALVISAVTYALAAAVLVGVDRRPTAPRPSGRTGRPRTMRISARNQLTGTVTEVSHGDVTTTVKVRLSGGDVITSSITREAAEELDLGEGTDVTVIVKASDVILAAAVDD